MKVVQVKELQVHLIDVLCSLAEEYMQPCVFAYTHDSTLIYINPVRIPPSPLFHYDEDVIPMKYEWNPKKVDLPAGQSLKVTGNIAYLTPVHIDQPIVYHDLWLRQQFTLPGIKTSKYTNITLHITPYRTLLITDTTLHILPQNEWVCVYNPGVCEPTVICGDFLYWSHSRRTCRFNLTREFISSFAGYQGQVVDLFEDEGTAMVLVKHRGVYGVYALNADSRLCPVMVNEFVSPKDIAAIVGFHGYLIWAMSDEIYVRSSADTSVNSFYTHLGNTSFGIC